MRKIVYLLFEMILGGILLLSLSGCSSMLEKPELLETKYLETESLETKLNENYNIVDTETDSDEDYDIVDTEISQNSGPNFEDYDEIILSNERYYLCKKYEQGFDVNEIYYGIYDDEIGDWAVDFMKLPETEKGEPTFYDCGCGVFSYVDGMMYCVSASYGDCISYYPDMFKGGTILSEDIPFFAEDKAFIQVRGQYDKTYVNGNITPSSKLFMLSVDGEKEEVHVPGFKEDEMYYWRLGRLSADRDTTIYANSFDSYNSGNRKTYIYVYFYENDTCTVIDNQEYLKRLSQKNNVTDATVSLQNDLIRVEGLEGEDGQVYYAEFDQEGNIVTEATPM